MLPRRFMPPHWLSYVRGECAHAETVLTPEPLLFANAEAPLEAPPEDCAAGAPGSAPAYTVQDMLPPGIHLPAPVFFHSAQYSAGACLPGGLLPLICFASPSAAMSARTT